MNNTPDKKTKEFQLIDRSRWPTQCITLVFIKKKANINAKDFEGNTPLHTAAKYGCLTDVISLVFEGNAKVLSQDNLHETPLHQAKSSKILDILLMKAKIEDLLALEFRNKEIVPLFERILHKHPASMKTYLDKMVKTSNSESDVYDQHIIFNLSLFNHKTTEKQNYLDKHIELINNGCSDMLTHPLMRLFISMKWQPHKRPYQINFFIFLAFVLVFTAHGIYCIDYLQCDGTGAQNGNHTLKNCNFNII